MPEPLQELYFPEQLSELRSRVLQPNIPKVLAVRRWHLPRQQHPSVPFLPNQLRHVPDRQLLQPLHQQHVPLQPDLHIGSTVLQF